MIKHNGTRSQNHCDDKKKNEVITGVGSTGVKCDNTTRVWILYIFQNDDEENCRLITREKKETHWGKK
jgi:hypothetical protein